MKIELCIGSAGGSRYLGVSQQTFSRLVNQYRDRLLITGSSRSTRYALKREIPGVGTKVPIYRVLEDGEPKVFGYLYPISSKGFYFEGDVGSDYYEDLPYFLNDLRPSGFIGKLLPLRHPEENLPKDTNFWTAEQALSYLCNFGRDTVGNFIIGQAAMRAELQYRSSKKVPQKNYSDIAKFLLEEMPAGSSAAGEQPKFLAHRVNKHFIVKFSPKRENPVALRWADLLIAEHLASRALREFNFRAVESRILISENQVFLEASRFDRLGATGRRGVISMTSLDAEFVGLGQGWRVISASLSSQGIISHQMKEEISKLEVFGRLIANNDMHTGNMSFVLDGLEVVGVAPVYDMTSMFFVPVGNQIVQRHFSLEPPLPEELPIWNEMLPVAISYWKALEEHLEVSPEFREIARQVREQVES